MFGRDFGHKDAMQDMNSFFDSLPTAQYASRLPRYAHELDARLALSSAPSQVKLLADVQLQTALAHRPPAKIDGSTD
jgi:hypothetical protein